MLIEIEGCITSVSSGLIGHGVNCCGVFNSGVAKSIREVYPEAYLQYKNIANKSWLSKVQFVPIDNKLCIANMFTQETYGYIKKTHYASLDAVKNTLKAVENFCWNTTKPLHIPPLGCGRGGLNWEEQVRPLVQASAAALEHRGINVHVWFIPDSFSES